MSSRKVNRAQTQSFAQKRTGVFERLLDSQGPWICDTGNISVFHRLSAKFSNIFAILVGLARLRMSPQDLRARELQQRTDVVVICCPKSGDIFGAGFADVGQIHPTPRKRFVAEPRHHQISHQARRSTIAVRKRVNRDQPVMQTDGNFVGRECRVFNPVSSVVKSRSQFDGDPHRFDADVPLGSAQLAGPCPDVTEEAFVKLPKECLLKQVSAANAPGPDRARCNVRLFRRVQIPSKGDPSLEQTFALFRFERG